MINQDQIHLTAFEDVELVKQEVNKYVNALVQSHNTFKPYEHLLVNKIEKDSYLQVMGRRLNIPKEKLEEEGLYYLVRCIDLVFEGAEETLEVTFPQMEKENNDVKICIEYFGFNDVKWENDILQLTFMLKFSYICNNKNEE